MWDFCRYHNHKCFQLISAMLMYAHFFFLNFSEHLVSPAHK